jgi:hypothetical protein
VRLRVKSYAGVLTILLFALPAWSRTDSAPWSVSQAATIGGTQIKPGEYQLKAEEGQGQVQVVHDGKVIAQVTCKWIQLPAKSAETEVLVNNGQVTQIQFSGRMEAIQFNP